MRASIVPSAGLRLASRPIAISKFTSPTASAKRGYEPVPQVGVDGFRIDTGVRHPRWPNGFLARIECDGATYHSGVTVRDSDRLRQEILEGLGWRLYRVWSTDWFGNPDREMTKLLAWLDDLRRAAA